MASHSDPPFVIMLGLGVSSSLSLVTSFEKDCDWWLNEQEHPSTGQNPSSNDLAYTESCMPL